MSCRDARYTVSSADQFGSRPFVAAHAHPIVSSPNAPLQCVSPPKHEAPQGCAASSGQGLRLTANSLRSGSNAANASALFARPTVPSDISKTGTFSAPYELYDTHSNALMARTDVEAPCSYAQPPTYTAYELRDDLRSYETTASSYDTNLHLGTYTNAHTPHARRHSRSFTDDDDESSSCRRTASQKASNGVKRVTTSMKTLCMIVGFAIVSVLLLSAVFVVTQQQQQLHEAHRMLQSHAIDSQRDRLDLTFIRDPAQRSNGPSVRAASADWNDIASKHPAWKNEDDGAPSDSPHPELQSIKFKVGVNSFRMKPILEELISVLEVISDNKRV